MKKISTKILNLKKQNNKGFSLIELIVTVLMMGLVSAVLFMFISMSGNSYRIVNADTIMQDEASFAMNYISDIALVSKDFEAVSDYPVNYSYTNEEGNIVNVSGRVDIYAFEAGNNSVSVQYNSSNIADNISKWENANGSWFYLIVYEKESRTVRFLKLKNDFDNEKVQIPAELLNTGERTCSLRTLNYGKVLEKYKVLGNKRKLLTRYISAFSISDRSLSSGDLMNISFTVSYDGKEYAAAKNVAARNR